MSASTLGKNIAGALYSALKDGSSYTSSTPVQANAIIAKEITSYLLSNTKLTATYIGVIPSVPPTPESTTDSQIKIIGTCAPPSGSDFQSWVSSVETNIKAGFMVSAGSQVKPISPILALNVPTPLSGFLNQGMLKSAHEGNHDSPQEPVWIQVATGILGWLNAGIPSPPTYAASFVGTGTATVIKITVS